MPYSASHTSTQFLMALIAIFMLWSQVGGQSHLDLVPWPLKLGLAGALRSRWRVQRRRR